jgi:hypothetical protein
MLLLFLQQTTAGTWRESLQLTLVFIGVVGGLIAAVKALFDFRENLLWKRANAARESITEIHQHPRASTAVTMMDWVDSKHDYEIKDDVTKTISYEDILAALNKKQIDCINEDERFIRDCFDWFFYFIGRIERYMEIKLMKFEDVEPIFRPYARIISGKHAHIYQKFMRRHEYGPALQFWERYKGLKPFVDDSEEVADEKNAPAATK